MLTSIRHLGLAIGIETGETPVTRIGTRGEGSVRCSVSRAVSGSEQLQSNCDGTQTALGPRAISQAPAAIRRLFDAQGIVSGLDAFSLDQLLATPAVIRSGSASAYAAPHAYARPRSD